MKYFNNIIFLIFGVSLFVACEKHEVEYNTTSIDDVAEFQLHYFVPVTAVASNNITKIEVNDQLYANQTALLTTYNAVPNVGVGRFYTTKTGVNNIKLYQGSGDNQKKVYDQSCTLTKGKQNIFIYDFNQPPIVFDNGYPYVGNLTMDTDTTAWVKFYNFLFEKEGTPTDLKLQYQYQYIKDYSVTPNKKSDWINIGNPVAFGETTGWQPVVVIKRVNISSGYARLDYRIKIIDDSGTDLGELQVLNASNKYVNYSNYSDAYIGRRYHHVLSGLRTAAPRTAVRQFTAL